MTQRNSPLPYRGRLAPSPTGFLHVGHALTFAAAYHRARSAGGVLVFRNEDLDPQRARSGFADAMIEDLLWLGIDWDEGFGREGPFAPYSQSERREHYLAAWRKLRDLGAIYPCSCSRKDLATAAAAPNDVDDEPIYPGACRNRDDGPSFECPAGVNWRFRVPNGQLIQFDDLHLGPQTFVAGRDFGDFVVFRRDDVPGYQLAVVVDDAAMEITEVVRGSDLLKSTARQILLARALHVSSPSFYHCDLVRDDSGIRLAKRHDSLCIRALRRQGWTPQQVLDFARRGVR